MTDVNRFLNKWYVVYTRPNTEKKVAALATEMGIETYLPLYEVVRQWSDRKKRLDVPLFPNYLFVRVNQYARARVLNIKECVKFVSIGPELAVVSDEEISMIRKILNEDYDVSAENYFAEGMKVKIRYGQFAGLEGTVIKRNGNTRLLIRIEKLMKAFSFNIPVKYLDARVPESEHLAA